MAGFEPVIRRKSDSEDFSPVIRRTQPKGGDPKSDRTDALATSLDRLQGSLYGGAEVLARDQLGDGAIADWLKKQKMSNEADVAASGYRRPEDVGQAYDNFAEGDILGGLNALSYDAAENAANFGVQGLQMLAKGNPLTVGLAGGFHALQTAGDMEQQQREMGAVNKDGNVDFGASDYGIMIGNTVIDTAMGFRSPASTGSGLLKKVTAGGKRAAKEGLQEAGQEASTVLSADIKDDVHGKDIEASYLDYARASTSGFGLGAGVRGTSDVAIAGGRVLKDGAKKFANADFMESEALRNLDEDDAALAKRFEEKAGSEKEGLAILGNVHPTEGVKPINRAIQNDLRIEADAIIKGLMPFADAEGQIEMRKLKRNIDNQTARITEDQITSVENAVKNDPRVGADIKRLRSISRQMFRVDEFSRPSGELGGISKYSRYLDPFDPTNSGIPRIAGLAATAKFSGMNIVANHLARRVDEFTNRRSPIKRFVDKVNNKAITPREITGQRGVDVLRGIKEANQAAKDAAKQQAVDQKAATADQKAQDRNAALIERERIRGEYKLKLDQQKAARAAESAKQKTAATKRAETTALLGDANPFKAIWETGEVPRTGDLYKGYRAWQHFTGIQDVREIAQILDQMVQQQQLPPEFAAAFKDPAGIKQLASKEQREATYRVQEVVRQVAGNRVEPQSYESFEAAEVKLDQENDPKIKTADAALRKLGDINMRRTKDGKETRKVNGERVYGTIQSYVNMATDLSIDEKIGLLKLADAMNQPHMLKVDRQALMEQYFDENYSKSKRAKDYIKKQELRAIFTNLALAGNNTYPEGYGPDGKLPNPDPEEYVETRERKAKKRKEKSQEEAKKEAEKEVEEASESPAAEVDNEAKELSPEQEVFDFDGESPIAETTAPTPVVAEAKKRATKAKGNKGSNRKGTTLPEQVFNSILGWFTKADLVHQESETFNQYLEELSRRGTLEADLQLLMLSQPGHLTQNSLVERFANTTGMKIDMAAKGVDATLAKMEAAGQIHRIQQKGNAKLKVDGRRIKDESGNWYDVITIKPVENSELSRWMNVARAIDSIEKLADISEPAAPITGETLAQGEMGAVIKDQKSDISDMETKAALIDFINYMRNQPFAINPEMMEQVRAAVLNNPGKRNNPLLKALVPTKDKKDGLRAYSQLEFQTSQQSGSLHMFQNYTGQKAGRITAMNSSANTHGGDFMKGILRAPTKSTIGNQDGYKLLFQSFGNILGKDKDAPFDRRNAVLQPGVMEALVNFSVNPAKRTENKMLKQILEDSEGFFQTLNVANEVANMVNFATERHPAVAKSAPALSDLMTNSEVMSDLQQNYETDYIIQLDANNNSFQLGGLMIGDLDLLVETGMQPSTANPDTDTPADVYIKPALRVAQNIPELAASQFATDGKKLRKVFKRAISNYIYGASHDSRKQTIEEGIGDVAAATGMKEFGFDPKDSVVVLDKAQADTLKKGGLITKRTKSGNERFGIKKITGKDGKTQYVTVTEKFSKRDGTTKDTRQNTSGEETMDDAILSVLKSDFLNATASAVSMDLQANFPALQQYLSFADKVAEIVKKRENPVVRVKSPDGVQLVYDFKDDLLYTGVPGAIAAKEGTRDLTLGVAVDTAVKGKGLAAFMAHQLDGYVLRETLNRVRQKLGKDPIVYNTIHDSHGMHPAEAKLFQDTILEVMQDLGKADFNIFEQIIRDNGIDPVLEGVKMPERKAVPRVDPSSIPTAVS